MAPGDTPDTKENTFDNPEPLNSFSGIFRTGWGETARRRHNARPCLLIYLDHPQSYCLHYPPLKPARAKSPLTDFPRFSKFAAAAGPRAIKTISHPGFTGTCRTISRSSRFIWFLTTAFPTRRLTTNPNLDELRVFGKARTTISLPDQDLPLA
jgi:hypothetical protein